MQKIESKEYIYQLGLIKIKFIIAIKNCLQSYHSVFRNSEQYLSLHLHFLTVFPNLKEEPHRKITKLCMCALESEICMTHPQCPM